MKGVLLHFHNFPCRMNFMPALGLIGYPSTPDIHFITCFRFNHVLIIFLIFRNDFSREKIVRFQESHSNDNCPELIQSLMAKLSSLAYSVNCSIKPQTPWIDLLFIHKIYSAMLPIRERFTIRRSATAKSIMF